MREPVVRLTNVGKTTVVQEYLLQDERGNGFAQFRAGFHDAQTQWNDFGCE